MIFDLFKSVIIMAVKIRKIYEHSNSALTLKDVICDRANKNGQYPSGKLTILKKS
jgi:hypothetical protein